MGQLAVQGGAMALAHPEAHPCTDPRIEFACIGYGRRTAAHRVILKPLN